MKKRAAPRGLSNDRKRAEEARAILAAIVESSEDAIISKDISGTITSWNAAAERLFGYLQEEAVGQPIARIVPPELQAEEADILERLRHGNSVAHFETVRLTKDGRRIPVSLTVSPVRDGAGAIIGASKILRDISGRRLAEEKIARQNEELQAQSEELAQQNEELNRQHEELQQSAEELQEQSEELQAQSEELQTANQELNQREAMLQTILASLRETGDEQQMLRRLCVTLVQLTGEAVASAAVVEQVGEQLVVRVHAGTEELRQERWPLGNSFASLVMAEGRTAFVEDLARRPDLLIPEPQGRKFRSLLATPLRVYGQPIGAVEVYSLEPRQWTKHQFQMIEWAADQCSRALETVRLQGELRESEQRFRTMADAIPQLAWVAKADGWIYWYNRRWYEYTGTTPEQMDGWGWQSVHDAQVLPQVLEQWKRSIATGEPFDMVFPLRGADGVFRPFLTRVMPLKDVQGRVLQWFGTNTDIAERKQAEAALQRSRDRQELLSRTISSLLTAPDPQAVIDRLCNDVRIFLDCAVFFNFLLDPQARRLRLNACGGVDRRIASKVEDLELGASLCGSAAQGGCRVLAENLPASSDPRSAIVRHLGIRAYACHPLLGPDNEVLGTLSFGAGNRDRFSPEDLDLMKTVTDHVAVALLRRRAEDALRLSEEKFATAFAQNPAAMTLTRLADGLFLEVNDTWVALLGYRREEVLGALATQFPIWPTSQARSRFVHELREQGSIRGWEQEFRRKSGESFTAQLSAQVLTMQDQTMVLSTLVDITERKRAEGVLAQSKEELERLVAERTAKLEELVGELEHFSYTITHDMRAPLRAMKGYGEVVNELCAECQQQEPKGFLQRIMTSADRMDALIRDALNYSRSVRQELPLELVDTGALLRGMLDSYPEFQRSKAQIEIRGHLPVVIGNEAGLTQCFSNLLGNAVKFVKPGQTPEIRVYAEQQDGRARIWVEDKGIGVPKELLPRVFEMFSRGHKTYDGTGIGLALVRKVMDRMGGKVGAESEEGKGSRFWLELELGGAPAVGPSRANTPRVWDKMQ